MGYWARFFECVFHSHTTNTLRSGIFHAHSPGNTLSPYFETKYIRNKVGPLEKVHRRIILYTLIFSARHHDHDQTSKMAEAAQKQVLTSLKGYVSIQAHLL